MLVSGDSVLTAHAWRSSRPPLLVPTTPPGCTPYRTDLFFYKHDSWLLAAGERAKSTIIMSTLQSGSYKSSTLGHIRS